MDKFDRLVPILGNSALDKLKSKNIIVFGLGGVGGYVVEALVRSGIYNLTLVDNDVVSLNNFNRQLISTQTTLGMKKITAFKNRILDINPECNVITYDTFFLPDNNVILNWDSFDYIIDCVDTITAKIELCKIAKEKDIPIISSMGTGNKIHPELLEITTIEKTSICPLAKVMRRELSKRNIKNIKVVYSKEMPIKNENFSRTPASFIAVPATAGLYIATEVIFDLLK